MARAALNWTVRDLAEATHLHRNTISNLETGRYVGDAATLAAIETVLKRAGVEFIDDNGGGPGVRLRKKQHSETRRYMGDALSFAEVETVLKQAGVELIDENGGGPGVRLRKRQQKKG